MKYFFLYQICYFVLFFYSFVITRRNHASDSWVCLTLATFAGTRRSDVYFRINLENGGRKVTLWRGRGWKRLRGLPGVLRSFRDFQQNPRSSVSPHMCASAREPFTLPQFLSFGRFMPARIVRRRFIYKAAAWEMRGLTTRYYVLTRRERESSWFASVSNHYVMWFSKVSL